MFQKGQSGNPKGRPKRGDTIAELLRVYLGESTMLENGDSVTRKQTLIHRLFTIATIGDPAHSVSAIKLILEYTDGKPVQPVDSQGGLLIRVEYANDNADST